MKTIGLIGGMSWESSQVYYRIMNEEVKRRLGGLHSAQILMYSVDFAPLEVLLRGGRWDELGAELRTVARRLQDGGAEMILIGTNTMHHVADCVGEGLRVPLLHIADSTGRELRRCGVSGIALLGTRFTMEMEFYRQRLRDVYTVESLVPDAEVRNEINRIVFDELCRGVFRDDSRATLLGAIRALEHRGAQGVVLACTELPLVVKPSDTSLPVFDTLRLHALDAVDRALDGTASARGETGSAG